MSTDVMPPITDLDLSQCDREPIHIPGSVQPHGLLLALDEVHLTILQTSQNTLDLWGIDPKSLLGKPLGTILDAKAVATISDAVEHDGIERNSLYLATVSLGEQPAQFFRAIGHRSSGILILEFEPAASQVPISFYDVHALVVRFLGRLHHVRNPLEICRLAAAEVRKITGFDRVLIYKFDQEWNGKVIAEDRNGELPSYLGLQFPASDIPSQARALYEINRLRLIPTNQYVPAPLVPAINPKTDKPLDLTYAALRSVSPVHLEYMRNMGTAASLSISILKEGRLWGLLSCHNKTPRMVPFEIRTACDFLGQVLSLQLSEKERAIEFEERIRLKAIQGKLLAGMAQEEHFINGLERHADDLMTLVESQGVAILFEERCILAGTTPVESDVRQLADWLSSVVHEEVFAVNDLSARYPEAKTYQKTASGILAIEISKLHHSFVIWFRPERREIIDWGGDPRKPVEADAPGRLHPRRSFEQWRQTVENTSALWRSVHISAAGDLRNAVVGIVLRKAEEMAELSEQLKASNKELEAFSYSVSHDLRAPFRHIVGYSELLNETEANSLSEKGRRYLRNVIDSAQFAGSLVDNLLRFSQIGRTALALRPVDLNAIAQDVQAELAAQNLGRTIHWSIDSLPIVEGDLLLLRLVIQNLFSNAVKYTRNRPEAIIQVRVVATAEEYVFSVKDNGVGFDMKYVDKLFGVFQRLHRMEDFEGTGIGLANVRRIVARHGGRTWAEGTVNEGATFYFSLPKPKTTEEPTGA